MQPTFASPTTLRHSEPTIEIQDLTKNVASSHLVAIVYYRSLNRYIEIGKDGLVRLISPAGTVSAQFKETEKRDLLRQQYIQMLLANGIRGAEFERSLQAIARVDQRLQEEGEALALLEQQTQTHLSAWATTQGLSFDVLTEDEWQQQVEQAIQQVRAS